MGLFDDYFWPHIDKYDLGEKVKPLIASGMYYIRPSDGKIAQEHTQLDLEPPWIYTRPRVEANCRLWHGVMFQVFDIFPPDCLNCWKVVVRPRTIVELIQLYELQENHTQRFCKCGIELRDYVPYLYGGYFYCNSEAEGYEVMEEVRQLVDEHISPDVSVTLKRYCTEFEVRFGSSREIEDNLPEDNQLWANTIDKVFDVKAEGETQPMWLRQHIIKNWILFALDRGDQTANLFNGGNPILTPGKTYTRETPL